MNKKTSLVLTTLITAVSLMFGSSGCTKNEPYIENSEPSNDYFVCEFYTLQEAYDNSLLNITDLKNISYFQDEEVYYVEQGEDYSNSENWHKLDFQPTIDLPVLDSETAELIKISFYYKNIRHFKDSDGNVIKYKKDLVRINDFLGCYNGSYVVSMSSTVSAYGPGAPNICVGGIILYAGAPAYQVFKVLEINK